MASWNYIKRQDVEDGRGWDCGEHEKATSHLLVATWSQLAEYREKLQTWEEKFGFLSVPGLALSPFAKETKLKFGFDFEAC